MTSNEDKKFVREQALSVIKKLKCSPDYASLVSDKPTLSLLRALGGGASDMTDDYKDSIGPWKEWFTLSKIVDMVVGVSEWHGEELIEGADSITVDLFESLFAKTREQLFSESENNGIFSRHFQETKHRFQDLVERRREYKVSLEIIAKTANGVCAVATLVKPTDQTSPTVDYVMDVDFEIKTDPSSSVEVSRRRRVGKGWLYEFRLTEIESDMDLIINGIKNDLLYSIQTSKSGKRLHPLWFRANVEIRGFDKALVVQVKKCMTRDEISPFSELAKSNNWISYEGNFEPDPKRPDLQPVITMQEGKVGLISRTDDYSAQFLIDKTNHKISYNINGGKVDIRTSASALSSIEKNYGIRLSLLNSDEDVVRTLKDIDSNLTKSGFKRVGSFYQLLLSKGSISFQINYSEIVRLENDNDNIHILILDFDNFPLDLLDIDVIRENVTTWNPLLNETLERMREGSFKGFTEAIDALLSRRERESYIPKLTSESLGGVELPLPNLFKTYERIREKQRASIGEIKLWKFILPISTSVLPVMVSLIAPEHFSISVLVSYFLFMGLSYFYREKGPSTFKFLKKKAEDPKEEVNAFHYMNTISVALCVWAAIIAGSYSLAHQMNELDLMGNWIIGILGSLAWITIIVEKKEENKKKLKLPVRPFVVVMSGLIPVGIAALLSLSGGNIALLHSTDDVFLWSLSIEGYRVRLCASTIWIVGSVVLYSIGAAYDWFRVKALKKFSDAFDRKKLKYYSESYDSVTELKKLSILFPDSKDTLEELNRLKRQKRLEDHNRLAELKTLVIQLTKMGFFPADSDKLIGWIKARFGNYNALHGFRRSKDGVEIVPKENKAGGNTQMIVVDEIVKSFFKKYEINIKRNPGSKYVERANVLEIDSKPADRGLYILSKLFSKGEMLLSCNAPIWNDIEPYFRKTIEFKDWNGKYKLNLRAEFTKRQQEQYDQKLTNTVLIWKSLLELYLSISDQVWRDEIQSALALGSQSRKKKQRNNLIFARKEGKPDEPLYVEDCRRQTPYLIVKCLDAYSIVISDSEDTEVKKAKKEIFRFLDLMGESSPLVNGVKEWKITLGTKTVTIILEEDKTNHSITIRGEVEERAQPAPFG